MADLAAILSTVSRGSRIALRLYQIATSHHAVADSLCQSAKSITAFSKAVKHLGAVIQENDTLLSPEAVEALDDILEQCNSILNETEATVFEKGISRDGDETSQYVMPKHNLEHDEQQARLSYLRAHMDSLTATIAVMQQALYTAQILIWGRVRPSISPQQAAGAVANERNQLELLIIEQQTSLLQALRLYEPARPDARMLMDKDSSQSLVAMTAGVPKPTDLHRYQERYLKCLGSTEAEQNEWLPTVCGVAQSHLERLLEKWTKLQHLHDKIDDEERHLKAQQRETQQASVESDDEEDSAPKCGTNGARLDAPTPQRPGSVQPLFSEVDALPIPGRQGPTAPLSPAPSSGASPRTSRDFLAPSVSAAISPMSPRSSVSSLPPTEAAAAVEAKDKDDDTDLEIPWKLFTRKHYWAYIDSQLKDSDTDLDPSHAYSDSSCRTEILASWVCKEALQEAGFNYTQVQKETPDGRRTKFETCFCIQQALTFKQVQLLIERTVEIYRKTQPPTPPPARQRRTSFDRPPVSPRHGYDRDKTPLARPHPPLERSTTYAYPPPPPPRSDSSRPPPSLDRTHSLPGLMPIRQAQGGPVQSPLQAPPHLTIPPNPYQPQQPSHSPQTSSFTPTTFSSQTNSFNPSMPYIQPQSQPPYPQPPNPYFYPQQPQPPYPTTTFNPLAPPLYRNTYPPPPSHTRTRSSHHSSASRNTHHSDLSTTDSDTDHSHRSRRHRTRSKSRRASGTSGAKRKGAALGTLATVGGLAALLDGLEGIV